MPPQERVGVRRVAAKHRNLIPDARVAAEMKPHGGIQLERGRPPRARVVRHEVEERDQRQKRRPRRSARDPHGAGSNDAERPSHVVAGVEPGRRLPRFFLTQRRRADAQGGRECRDGVDGVRGSLRPQLGGVRSRDGSKRRLSHRREAERA